VTDKKQKQTHIPNFFAPGGVRSPSFTTRGDRGGRTMFDL